MRTRLLLNAGVFSFTVRRVFLVGGFFCQGATHVVVGLQVGGVAVAAEVEGIGEQCARALVVCVGGGDMAFDSVELRADAVLLGLEKVEGDGINCGSQ